MYPIEPIENDQAGSNQSEKDRSDVAPSGETTSLDSLVRSVRTLTLKIQELEGALEVANRKIAIYEGFDESIRDAMAYSLRKAFEIRERAEQEASDLLARARSEEAALRREVQKMAAERDALAAERDALRQSIEDARSELERQTSQRAVRRSEKEQLLAEVLTLERRLQVIRSSLESPPAEERSGVLELNQAQRVDVRSFPEVGDHGTPDDARNGVTEALPAHKLVADESQELLEVIPLPTVALPLDSPTPASEARRESPSMVGESSSAEAVAVTAEVELIISPVHSFPKLVELERALQTLPEVKNLYARDFHYGVATLSIGLANPEAREDLPAKLEGLPGWNLTVLSSPPNRIEAKIGA